MADVRESGPRRSLILAGGGMKVGYQAGVLQVLLDEAGLEFDHADGTAAAASTWRWSSPGLTGHADRQQLANDRPVRADLAPAALALPDALAAAIDADLRSADAPAAGLGRRLRRRSARSPIAGSYNVFNFTDKVFETHSEADITPDLFKACFALPVWFPAVEIGGKTYIDGVYWKDANLTEAVRRGADEIWVIWTVSETPDYRPGAYGQYFHIIEAIADGRFYEELRADRGDQRGGPGRHRHDPPRDPGPRHPPRGAGAARLPAVLLGRRHEPDRRHGRPRRAGVPRRAGRRRSSRPGRSRHRSACASSRRCAAGGRWARPIRGSARRAAVARGRRWRSISRSRSSDMDAFLEDPNRVATARGTVECPALGGRLPIDGGTFNLLKIAASGTREMRYTLPFTARDGERYLLVGVKYVAQDAGARCLGRHDDAVHDDLSRRVGGRPGRRQRGPRAAAART